ncbi:MAG: TetR family transcriptional regulator [Acidimicrobiales bacterium]
MTGTREAAGASAARRGRNAGATRLALLAAAQDLFGQKGYERTTTREIGEAAGVDPALIARYFGSKADLYLAAVAAERLDGGDGAVEAGQVDAPFADLAQVVGVVLDRTARLGPGPTLQALVRHDASEEIREAAKTRLVRRMVEPVAAGYGDAGIDRPTLRAQVAVAALLGVALGRSLGWFDELHEADPDTLTAMVVDAFREPR